MLYRESSIIILQLTRWMNSLMKPKAILLSSKYPADNSYICSRLSVEFGLPYASLSTLLSKDGGLVLQELGHITDNNILEVVAKFVETSGSERVLIEGIPKSLSVFAEVEALVYFDDLVDATGSNSNQVVSFQIKGCCLAPCSSDQLFSAE